MAFASNRSKEVTEKQYNFIPKLKNWLEMIDEYDDIFMNGNLAYRDKQYYVALLDKILVLGQYTYDDGLFLNELTQKYIQMTKPIGSIKV